MRTPILLAHFLPALLVFHSVKLAIDAQLWRLLTPASMWRYAPKERSLVQASVVKGAVGLKMMVGGHVLLGPMLFAAAVLFWILASRLAGSRR